MTLGKINLNEVHVWSAYLVKEKNNVSYFYSILSTKERNRANSFIFSKDQTQYIVTRGILRKLLSNYLGQAPENIEIVYGDAGKPYILEKKRLYFNVSHSKDYALYAITRKHEVGIDLEYFDKNIELEDMASYIFSTPELIKWKILDEEERVNTFFRHWVSKEAFLKASGKGWLEHDDNNNFNKEMPNIHVFDCIPGYASALFIQGIALNPTFYIWN